MKINPFFIATIFLVNFSVLSVTMAADAPDRILTGHTDYVKSVEFSPNGDMLATKSGDSTIRLWDPHTGQFLRTIHTNSEGGIAFSPDGKVLASGGGAEKVVNLWNPNTGKLLRSFKAHHNNVSNVAFSPNGNFLASASTDGTIRLWKPNTDHLLRILHPKKIDGIAFSHDSRILANGGREDSNIKLWNTETGALIHTLKPDIHDVYDIAFSSKEHFLASAGWHGIDLWDGHTGELVRSFPREIGRIMLCVAFSPDGNILACGKDSGGIDMWNTNTGTLIGNLAGDGQTVYDVAFSPDGRLLASVGSDNKVRLWEITPLQENVPPKFPEGLTGPNIKIWTEDFNNGNLDSWTRREHQRERVKWQGKHGQLDVQTQPFCNGRLNINDRLAYNTKYSFEFTAFPIDAQQLRVKLKILETENANAGLFIGKKPDSLYHHVMQHAYLFSNHTIGGPNNSGDYGEPTIGYNLSEIDVVFDRGQFHLYSEGEYITDFRSSLRTIDYVGIVVFPKSCGNNASVTLDDFEISGPSVSTVRIPKEVPEDISVDKPRTIDGVWVERFSNDRLDSWTQPKHEAEDKRATWQPKNGLLDVWIQPIPSHAFIQTYQLEFTDFPINEKELRVKVDVLEAHNANVGILIGQYDENGIGTARRTYKFLHKSSWPAIEFREAPDVKYENLNDIEIVFKNGHFELLSEGKHILEFKEPKLPTIDCLGLIAYTSEVPIAHFVMDNFIVSKSTAPFPGSLSVQAKDKATILWGELKKK